MWDGTNDGEYLVANGGQIAESELLFRIRNLLEGFVNLEVGEQSKARIDSSEGELW